MTTARHQTTSKKRTICAASTKGKDIINKAIVGLIGRFRTFETKHPVNMTISFEISNEDES